MNRLLVLELDGIDGDSLMGDEGLANVRRLLDAGVHGRLEGEAEAAPALPALLDDFERIHERLDADSSHLMHFILDPPTAAAFDVDLGRVLERLDGDTTLLIHSRRDEREGYFVMAGPGVPAIGAIEGVAFADLAPALMKLGGHEVDMDSPLADLLSVATEDEYSEDDIEAIIRERLNGLGYIG